MNEFKKERIKFYQVELHYWNAKRDKLIEKLLNENMDLKDILNYYDVVECEFYIKNYNEWLHKELQELE